MLQFLCDVTARNMAPFSHPHRVVRLSAICIGEPGPARAEAPSPGRCGKTLFALLRLIMHGMRLCGTLQSHHNVTTRNNLPESIENHALCAFADSTASETAMRLPIVPSC